MRLMEVATGRVIEEVMKRPVLWDTSHLFYRAKQARQRAWMEVFHALIPDFDDLPFIKQHEADKAIQQRWKTARDAYMRNKAQMKSGSKVKKYYYFDKCSFLDKIGSNSNEKTLTTVEQTAVPSKKQTESQVAQLAMSSQTPTPGPSSNVIADPLSTTTSDMVIKLESVTVDFDDNPEENNDDVSFDDGDENYDLSLSQLHTEVFLSDECLSEETPEHVEPKIKKALKRKLESNNSSIYKMIKETSEQMKDDNMAFFVSMLPIVNKFSDKNKLLFRSKVIQIALELSSQEDAR